MPSRVLLVLLIAVPCLTCIADDPLSLDPATTDLTLPNVLAPNLTTLANGDVLLTVLRKTDAGHQLVFTPVDGGAEPRVIVEGSDFFANWADVPGLVEVGEGSLMAHWLEDSGPETYDYGIRLARSTDAGATWTPLGWLNDDAWEAAEGEVIAGEHGFVSWIAERDGARAFWLDGRAATGHGEGHETPSGAMQLRTTTVVDGQVQPSELLDERVCDCCPTAAVATANGPLVAFRDRSEDEIRDIHILRGTADGWRRTVIDTSGWQIPGCPVNGPALAVEGDLVFVAWYTAHPEPRVVASWSTDGGHTFGEPIPLTTDTLGRVTAAILDGVGYVAWLRALESPTEDEMPPGEVRMVRTVSDGHVGSPVIVVETAATRRAGIPRLVVDGDELGLAWTEVVSGAAERPATTVRYRTVALPSTAN